MFEIVFATRRTGVKACKDARIRRTKVTFLSGAMRLIYQLNNGLISCASQYFPPVTEGVAKL